MSQYRKEIELWENKYLATYAIKSSQSKGRLHKKEDDIYRPCFQRDRDRILYSTAFKRLQYKTQVFLTHEGDFYRTRLTHTLEVVQHARTFARIFTLNEHLCEAIAMAHDLGHSPFGHWGEKTLHTIMKNYGGFEHNIQSLRIVDQLEKRYPNYDGLNLCFETREGIARHETCYDKPIALDEFSEFRFPSLEAQFVSISDTLAFCAHDLEDALVAKLIKNYDTLNNKLKLPFLKRIIDEVKAETRHARNGLVKNRIFIRKLIEQFTIAVIKQTEKNLKELNINSVKEVRNSKRLVVGMSPNMWSQVNDLRQYLYDEVYLSSQVLRMTEKGIMIIRRLFRKIDKNPRIVPKRTFIKYKGAKSKIREKRVICDFISGMTDKYAMDFYQQLFAPYERVMGIEH